MVSRQEILNQLDDRDVSWLVQHGANKDILNQFYKLWEKRETMIENGDDISQITSDLNSYENEIITSIDAKFGVEEEMYQKAIKKQPVKQKPYTPIASTPKLNPLGKMPKINLAPSRSSGAQISMTTNQRSNFPKTKNISLRLPLDMRDAPTAIPTPRPVKTITPGKLTTPGPDLFPQGLFSGIISGGIITQNKKNNSPEQRGTKKSRSAEGRINDMIRQLTGRRKKLKIK